jgi:hypothetical protein
MQRTCPAPHEHLKVCRLGRTASSRTPPTCWRTPWIDSDDVTNALLFLVSDEACYIIGVALPIDAGFLLK